MKKKILAFLLVSVLIFAGICPVTQASADSYYRLPPVSDIAQLKSAAAANGGFYGVVGNINISNKVTLEGTGQNEIAISSMPKTDPASIVVKNGGQLTISSPMLNLFGNGFLPIIRVEKGGKLYLKTGMVTSPLITMPEAPSILIEPGGQCSLYNSYQIIKNDFSMENVISGEYTEIIAPTPPEEIAPGDSPAKPIKPQKPQHSSLGKYQKAQISAKVVQVQPRNIANIYLTLPGFTKQINKITVQRLSKGHWINQYTYTRDTDSPVPIFSHGLPNHRELLGWNHSTKDQGFIHYIERWTPQKSSAKLTLRAVIKTNFGTATTAPTQVIMPKSGRPTHKPIDDSYGDIGGTRGGIGQGEHNRIPPVTANKNNSPKDNQTNTNGNTADNHQPAKDNVSASNSSTDNTNSTDNANSTNSTNSNDKTNATDNTDSNVNGKTPNSGTASPENTSPEKPQHLNSPRDMEQSKPVISGLLIAVIGTLVIVGIAFAVSHFRKK